jgi:glycosyltransferase involved in cell wall biosynthesis
MPTPISLPERGVSYTLASALLAEARVPARPAPVARGAPPQVPISATILTRDSAARLGEVLTALRWCDEVVVLDTGSTDETAAVAADFANVRFNRLAGPFPGFGKAHRLAVALARNDWILSVDSDEVVSRRLAAEIMALRLDWRMAYSIPFHNYFNGRRITTCGWAPDRHERLFNRTATNFCESAVHERVQTSRITVRRLSHPIRHYSYGTLDDFLRKMRAYGALYAEQHAGRKSSGPVKAVARSAWAFAKSYLIRRGCFQGYAGFVISVHHAQTVFWKYMLLHEANRERTA